MKILIRKFDGIWKRDRAPLALPAPAPNGTRERRHPFSVSRLDSRHVMVERCAVAQATTYKARRHKYRRSAPRRHWPRGSAPLVFRASGTHHALPKTDQRAAARLPHRRANRIRGRCRSRPVWHLRCGFCRGSGEAEATTTATAPTLCDCAKDGAPGNAGATAEAEACRSRNNEDNARTGRVGWCAWVRRGRNVCRPGRWPPGRAGCGRAGPAA